MDKLVIFGAGSSILVDLEETCTRLGLDLFAIVNNQDGPSFAIDQEKVIGLADVSDAMLAHPMVFALFTPGHRKFALDQARGLGATRFYSLIDPTAITPSSLKTSEGVFINCAVTIGGMSSLGAFSFINRSASLGHHCTVGEFASIEPGVDLLLEAGMERLRAKSIAQTEYLISLWEAILQSLGFTLKPTFSTPIPAGAMT